MKSYRRSVRVAELLRMKVSEIIIKKVNDPRLMSITITKVDITEDLRYAKIYYSVFGTEEEEKESMKSLQKATKYIKSLIGRDLGLRYVPELRFEFDKGFKQSIKIMDLLSEIEKENTEV
jgi:ribosome-binding factor A